MNIRKIKILGMGKYLPNKVISSSDLDKKMNKPSGWVEKKSGAKKRHFIDNENICDMGVNAAKIAIANANISKEEIDCIIFAAVSMQQLIPNTAAFIQKKLGLENSGIPAIDMNMVCLSFVSSLDVISYLIEAQRYNNVLIVSSEIASVGLNWNDPETCTIFGDGAAAAVISKSKENDTSKILASHMQTYSISSDCAELKSGGANYFPEEKSANNREDYFFQMNGKKSFRFVSSKIKDFIKNLLEKSKKTIEDLDLIIPHQASGLALRHLRKKLNVPKEKWMDIFSMHGNQIAASIPTALYEAIEQKIIKRGSTVMLLGSAAGLSIGGMILEY